jgi:hypothetical protein
MPAAKPDTIKASDIMRMVEAQGYRCALSGRELTPETASMDHKVAVSKGGGHALVNLWVVDHLVNIAKGSMSTEDFICMCRDVVAWQDKEASRQEDIKIA